MKRKTKKKNTKEEKEASNVYLYIYTKEREILQKRMKEKRMERQEPLCLGKMREK